MLETINKIEEFLSSDDVEMIELGARLMQEYMPRRMWKPILNEYSVRKEIVKRQHGYPYPYNNTTQTALPTYFDEEISVPKWTWVINEDNIINIKMVELLTLNGGMWNQLGSGGYQHTYNPSTFNLSALKTAVTEYFNQKQKPIKKCQITKRRHQQGWTSLRNK